MSRGQNPASKAAIYAKIKATRAAMDTASARRAPPLPCPACGKVGLGAVRNSPGIGRNRACRYCKARIEEPK